MANLVAVPSGCGLNRCLSKETIAFMTFSRLRYRLTAAGVTVSHEAVEIGRRNSRFGL